MAGAQPEGDLFTLMHQIFQDAWSAAPTDFSGLGLVLYRPGHALPHASLREAVPAELEEAIGANRIARVLSRLASVRSPWHDGFHFVDASDVRLTHVAQYISPPIPPRIGLCSFMGGARHMSAVLASRIDGVAMVGVLTSKGEISMYVDGERLWHQEERA